MAELASQPTSVQSIYGWHSENKLFVNRRYQRKLVWTLEEKQQLIESILKKYPIPAILLSERQDEAAAYEIIDGLQRLNSIVSFIEGSFPTLDGKYFNIDEFPTAKSNRDEGKFIPFSEVETIDRSQVSHILDYSLAISVMRNATNEEVDDVFNRINSYGHRLSDQERRQSGVQSLFSETVRKISSTIRGDRSENIISLSAMPEISIDLPMTRHGYDIKADNVFWTKQGILRATDLRDSMDEQCIADICASIVHGTPIERSKSALDDIYTIGSQQSIETDTAIRVYGEEKLSQEIIYCISLIAKAFDVDGGQKKLRDVIFADKNTNAFPAQFSLILLAIHKLIKSKKTLNDNEKLLTSLTGLSQNIDTSRASTSIENRQRNITIIEAIINSSFIDKDPSAKIYISPSSMDIENIIRQSSMELSRFELKQGLLDLSEDRKENVDLQNRLLDTACAIANNGPDRSGCIILGVADKHRDAERIQNMDAITSRKVGDWHIVGINREAAKLKISTEQYHRKIINLFANSKLSEALKLSITSSIDYDHYYGLGIIVINIPPQKEESYHGDVMFKRNGDNTIEVNSAKEVAQIAKRFSI